MFARPRRHSPLDIWPGFVDAMATLLMVIVFVLMTFVVAQLYLTDALNTKDSTLQSMEAQLGKIEQNLKIETLSKEEAQSQVTNLQKTLQLLQDQVDHLRTALQNSEKSLVRETESKEQALTTMNNLNKELIDLNEQVKRLSDALVDEEKKGKTQVLELESLKEKLNQALLSKVEELKALNQKLTDALADNENLNKEIGKLKDPKKLGLTQFRSEFFAKLMKVIGSRSDMRIVDDRFIFQSEVLFDRGSADVRGEGAVQLKTLAKTLKEITSKIPSEIKWVLRVDGHTDKLPISTSQFASNWELSSARAIAVVKALIKEGIDPNHLMAAGFGEFHPLSESKDEAELARNRRIEFKLDQK